MSDVRILSGINDEPASTLAKLSESLGKTWDSWHARLPGWKVRQAIRRAMAALPSASQRVFVQDYTMVSARRLNALERSIRTVVRNGIPGEIIECGTARGGSAALLALWLKRLKTKRKIYVFDTFEGLPAPTAADPDYDRAVQFTGLCRGQLDEVQNLFTSLGVLDHAVFVKGRFQDTMPGFAFPEQIALLHLDADWYDSTMVCLNHLWDRVPVGGIVQFDDYGSWQGCKKAVDEFFTSRGITDRLHYIDREGRYVVKTVAGSQTSRS